MDFFISGLFFVFLPVPWTCFSAAFVFHLRCVLPRAHVQHNKWVMATRAPRLVHRIGPYCPWPTSVFPFISKQVQQRPFRSVSIFSLSAQYFRNRWSVFFFPNCRRVALYDFIREQPLLLHFFDLKVRSRWVGAFSPACVPTPWILSLSFSRARKRLCHLGPSFRSCHFSKFLSHGRRRFLPGIPHFPFSFRFYPLIFCLPEMISRFFQNIGCRELM